MVVVVPVVPDPRAQCLYAEGEDIPGAQRQQWEFRIFYLQADCVHEAQRQQWQVEFCNPKQSMRSNDAL